MKIENKKILVTGGAGFIGSHLVEELVNRKNTVLIYDNLSSGSTKNIHHLLDKANCQFVHGDVRNLPELKRAMRDVEVVFHLATHCVRQSLTDPATNHEVNGTGTLNTLLAAKENQIQRFVYCSSSEVYGNAVTFLGKEGGELSEESPKKPTTIYGASKLVGEHYTLAFYQTHGLPSLVVRPFNTYGPKSHLLGPYGEVIPRFSCLLRAGLAPIIFGDGTQTRDFTYVTDTARGLVESAECDSILGDSLNIAHGVEVSIKELALKLCKLHKTKIIPKFVTDRPGDIQRLGACVDKAKRILNSELKVTIDEGLNYYLKWLDSQNLDYSSLAKKLTEKNWVQKNEESQAASLV